MADQEVEHELCGNCKKEIPQRNYVMHTAHCPRNITLCKVCKEPVPKSQYEEHTKTCIEKPKRPPKQKTPEPPKTNIEKSSYYQARKEVEDRKLAEKRERYLERHEKFLDTGYSMKSTESKSPTSPSSYIRRTSIKSSNEQSSSVKSSVRQNSVSKSPTTQNSSSNISQSSVSSTKSLSNGTGAIKKSDTDRKSSGAAPKPSNGLLPCRYCDLELPKLELEDHENYCGTRTDKCLDCGELVMFKNKQVHLDSNHGFLKLNDEPGPKASWDSSTQRSTNNAPSSPPRRRRFEPTVYTDFSQFDPTDYLPSNYRIPKPKIEKGESYKEISRRLDCKTEYIRNLLHDSASITVPLRHNGTVPRNHFNHNKGPAPQPPSRRRNPPTELCIPCEFCDTPIPHEDLIQHETGCRPDLACIKARSRRRVPLEDDDYFVAPPPSSTTTTPTEVELPCEFCDDMIPMSQLLRHQATCG